MYLAVRKSRSTSSERPGQMAFIRIYRGTKTSCSVSSSHLDNAHIDSSSSNRPAIVFRIAAKNEQGYGPATQIRWIQGAGALFFLFFCCFLNLEQLLWADSNFVFRSLQIRLNCGRLRPEQTRRSRTPPTGNHTDLCLSL